MKPTISEECAQDLSPPPTTLLPYNPQGITTELREHPHWLVCDVRGRPVKRPGIGSSKTNPKHWKDFATASRIAESESGLWPYLVLTEDSDFTIFDVDFKPRREGGRKAETLEQHQERRQRAENALDRLREDFPDRYESRSKSGNGFHLIVRGKFHGTGGKGKDEWSDVEIYTQRHGVALTGHVWQGHDNPAACPASTLQRLRDTIKGGAPKPDSAGEAIDRRCNGTVKPEWARQVLAELAGLHGRPERDNWRDMSSAVFDGVGVDTGIELLSEVWPEENLGEYRSLAKSLQWFAPWGTLNGFLKGSELSAEDPCEGFSDLTNEEAEANPQAGKSFDIVWAGDCSGVAMNTDFVEGLLTDGGASVIYGPSNCGKSFWILDLAVAVATGTPFRGELGVDQGAVIYVALEGSLGVRNRLEALRREGRLLDRTPLFLCFAPVSLLDATHAVKLSQSVKHAANQSGMACRLVILDTMARAMAGGDENSGKDMSAAVASIDAIRAATGAHVSVVHHCGKDEARGARGHSSLRAAVDTEIEVSRPEGETISTVRFSKQRDLPMGAAMPFSLVQVRLGTDRRGKPVTSCVVRHEAEALAAKPGRGGRKAKASPDDLLLYLPAASVKEWKERVKDETGLGDSQFYALKKILQRSGKIHRVNGTGQILRNDATKTLPDMDDDL
jgi:hypothetical protein